MIIKDLTIPEHLQELANIINENYKKLSNSIKILEKKQIIIEYQKIQNSGIRFNNFLSDIGITQLEDLIKIQEIILTGTNDIFIFKSNYILCNDISTNKNIELEFLRKSRDNDNLWWMTISGQLTSKALEISTKLNSNSDEILSKLPLKGKIKVNYF